MDHRFDNCLRQKRENETGPKLLLSFLLLLLLLLLREKENDAGDVV